MLALTLEETPAHQLTDWEHPSADGGLTLDGRGFAADVAIVGLGYVGLPTALTLHASGACVLGVEVSAQRVRDAFDGRVDLLESDLDRLRQAVNDPRSTMTTDTTAMSRARAVIICVPTPVDQYLVPDLSILKLACQMVTAAARRGQLIILTSTSYVGSTDDLIVAPLVAAGFTPGIDIFVAYSPERIDPGNPAVTHESVPRVVGGVTEECTDRAAALLTSCTESVHRVSSPKAAELTKLVENTFRAVNIALANEFAEASRALGLDVMTVIDAASTKPYGFSRFKPGPGVGGHCIPCDPHYLLWQLRQHRVQSPLIEQAMNGIATRPARVVERVREELSDIGKPLHGSRVLVVGVAYKPNVADVRESPAIEIIERLQRGGALVAYHDRRVPTLRLRDGGLISHTQIVDAASYDIVIAHTNHLGTDMALFCDASLVLDSTYSLPVTATIHRV